MDYQIDKNGKKIPVQQFSNLKEKLDTARGYVQMYNSMAADKGQPQIDVDVALKKIQKAHDKHYNLDNKYLGNGSLRDA